MIAYLVERGGVCGISIPKTKRQVDKKTICEGVIEVIEGRCCLSEYRYKGD